MGMGQSANRSYCGAARRRGGRLQRRCVLRGTDGCHATREGARYGTEGPDAVRGRKRPTRVLRIEDFGAKPTGPPPPRALSTPSLAAAAGTGSRTPTAAAAGAAAASAPASADASEDDETAPEEPEKDELTMIARLAGVGVSIVDGSRELLYASLEVIKFDFRRSSTVEKIQFVCNLLQLDNPAMDAAYPVILSATPVNVNPVPPFAQLSVIRKRVTALDYIPYASLLLQAMDVKVDTNLLLSVVDFVQRLPFSSDTAKEPLPQPPTPPSGGTRRIYMELLQLHPISISVTFSLGSVLNTRTYVCCSFVCFFCGVCFLLFSPLLHRVC